MISADDLQVGFLSSLTIVNKGSSLTIVNEGLLLTIVNKGSSFIIGNEGLLLTIVNKTTIFVKTILLKNDLFNNDRSSKRFF